MNYDYRARLVYIVSNHPQRHCAMLSQNNEEEEKKEEEEEQKEEEEEEKESCNSIKRMA